MSDIAVLNRPSVERQLRDRIEELEETLRQLKERKSTITFPREWKLTQGHSRVLSAMYEAPGCILSLDQAFDAVKLGEDSEYPENLVRSQIFKMRKRLAPFGIEILKRWGFGYELAPSSKAIIKNALEQRLS